MKKWMLLAALALSAHARSGTLSVIQKMPMGEMDSLNAAQEIVVTFSQPMVPLGDNDSMGKLCPIQLSPALPGSCHWQGTNTVAFRLDGMPKGGTRYSVTVPKGTASQVSGDKLAQDETWSFVTPRPRLAASAPGHDQRWVTLDPKLFVAFDQPMDAAKAKDYFELEEAEVGETDPELDPEAVTMADGQPETLRSKILTGGVRSARSDRLVPVQVSALTKDKWEALKKSDLMRGNVNFDLHGADHGFLIEPQRALKPDKRYRLWIKKGMPGADGAEGTISSNLIAFETYATFKSFGSSASGECTSSAGPGFKGAATLSPVWAFSNPVDADSFFKHLKISPEPPHPAKKDESARGGEENGGDEEGGYNDDGESEGGSSSFAGPVVGGQAITLQDRTAGADQSQRFQVPARPQDAPPLRFRTVDIGRLRLKAGQTYHFTVSAGLKDAFGNVLKQPIELDQKVADFCPDLDVPGGFSVLESYLKPRHPADGLNIKAWKTDVWDFNRDQYVGAMASIEEYRESGFAGDATKTLELNLEAPVNVRSRSYFDLKGALSGKPGGLIGFAMPSAQGEGVIRGLDNITDLGLTLKTAPDSTLVWVTRLKDGKPAADVPVELRLSDNKVAWKGRSDPKGIVRAPGWRELGTKDWDGTNDRPHVYAFASSAGGDAVMSSSRGTGIEGWRFGVPYEEVPQESQHRGLVFTDRGVYKPGESVKVKGVFRSLNGGDWSWPQSKDLHLELVDSRGKQVLKKDVALGERGSFDLSYEIPESAPTGQYNLRVEQRRRRLYDDISFRVEAFKPAAFEVRVHPERPQAFIGDELGANVEGWYLFGAPMSGSIANWELTLQPTAFSPPGWEEFDFNRGWWENEERYPVGGGSGALTLTAKGLGDFKASTSALSLKGPYTVTYEVGVTSPERQRLFGRAAQTLLPGNYFVGAKMEGRVFEMGKPMGVSVVVTDPAGHVIPNAKVTGRWRRREHLSVRRVGMNGRLTWENSSKDVDLPEFSLKSGVRPQPVDFKPDKPGEYYLNLSVADPQGRVNECGAMVYVAGPGEAWWDQQDHDLLQLVADKKDYKVGDTAKVMVMSPWDEADALVTVEREKVMSSWSVHLKGGASLISVPIKDEYLPNAYVSVTLVHGRDAKQEYGEEGVDLSKPQARFGYVSLPVHPDGRNLAVTMALDKEDYRPGATVKADLTALDAAGGAEVTELTVWAVDEGVLQLTGYQTPDLFNAFYGPRPLYVSNADTRLHVLGQRDYGEKGQNRGGGGGAGDLGGIDLRGDFRYVAHWSATVLTDAKGQAHVEFKLPDNLTAFRLMATAHTKLRFGKAQRRFTVSKPLMLRPSLPRFARLGDGFQGGVVVHNNGHQDATVDLLLKAADGSSVSVDGEAKRQLKVPAGKAIEALWPMHAKALGDATLEFRASADWGAVETDGLRWTLPVTLSEKRETVATSGISEDSVVEGVKLPGSGLAQKGEVTATFSSTALGGLKDGVSYLLEYPYGCLEQKMSRVLPIVSGADLLEAFKIQDLGAQKKAAQAVLDHLPDYQCGGGYIYWGDCARETPSPYLTAYVLEVAKLAKDAGYSVPDDSLQRAVEWLKGVFDEKQHWGYPYSEAELYVMRAYALDVLSLYGTSPTGYLSQLYGRRDKLPFLAKAHVLKAAQLLGGDDTVPKTLAQELLNQAKFAPRSIHFELPEGEAMPWVHSSSVQATEVCLEALLTARGGFPGDEKAVAWLTEERRDTGAWRSTQENAWGLRAFNAFYKRYESTPPSFKASLSLLDKGGDKTLWSQDFEGRSLQAQTKILPFEDVFGSGLEAKLRFAKEGKGRLYYGMTVKYIPASFDKPASEGFEVTREVKELETGARITGKLEAGKRYVVSLSVKSRQDRTFVALVDPLPGGVEVVNSAFANESEAGQRKQAKLGQGNDWYDSFMHTESYDDRVQVFANYLSAGEHHVSYLVQATTPGSYAKPAAWVEQMYQPEVFGRTVSEKVEVAPQP